MSIGYLDGQGCRIHGSNPTGSKKSAKIQTTPLHTLSKKKSDARYQLLAFCRATNLLSSCFSGCFAFFLIKPSCA